MRIILPLLIAGLLSVSCSRSGIVKKAGELEIRLSEQGFITALEHRSSGKNYLAGGVKAPLLQVRADNRYLLPLACSEAGDSLLTLTFEGNRTASVRIREKGAYLALELASLSGADSADLIVWGPYPTTIGETVGETVGVVRDSVFAIGIQALNLKTLGGYPTEESDIEPAYDIFETNSLIDVADSIQVIYRGQTAKKEPFGSVVQAYCRNRNRERIISNWQHEYYVAPPFDDGGVAGSAIALFGCPPSNVLNTISEIELTEGLPHPVIDGEWGKTARSATAGYLIMNFGTDNFEEALEATRKAGLRYLYHEGPFETWGHFKLNARQFPEDWSTLRLMVDRAAEEGIRIGVHTLSNFITTNDPYVTPVPDKRLARVGSSILTGAVGKDDKTIGIADPKFFNQMKNNTLRTVVIDSELIRYEQVTDREPWQLTGCQRGAFGTAAASHEQGAVIGKLMDHGYQTFLTDNDLSMEVSSRIAEFFNFTGCLQISFDGLEGNWSTGMGEYGRQRFTQNWYDLLKPELKGKVITDASGPGHFFWHSFTRMNWGEPWYAGFRESQTKYRLINQLYFRRNYIPAMLGWFRMSPETSIEDIEWLLARSAGFDAGYALVTSLDAIQRNGFGEKILATLKEWERARMAGAFPESLKTDMQDIRNEFHLEPEGPNNWNVYPWKVWRAEYKAGDGLKTIEMDQPNPDQPLQFILSAGQDVSATGIRLVIDGTGNIAIPLDLPAGHHIRYTGGSYVYLYDASWQPVASGQLIQQDITLVQGRHTLGFEAAFVTGGSEKGIRIELKTAGLPHTLSALKK